LIIINEPENKNKKILYFSNNSNLGKVVNKDANIGPPPNKSKKAGRAQQIHILILAAKLESVTAIAFFVFIFEAIVFI
ncbi:MAG: hypothetical protein CMJ07_03215, partial [Pelagibacterales bacterium]